jgi:hypothetical protein
MAQELGRDSRLSLDDYRKQWLILQVMPRLGHPEGRDIFHDLASRLSNASNDWVISRSKYYLERVHDLISSSEKRRTRKKTTLFCVLDEAQLAEYTDSHCSKEEDERTMVGEIVGVWEEQSCWEFSDLFMVVTGTGFFKERVESAMKSHLRRSVYRNHTETGAFSTREAQRRYLTEYLPRTLYNSDSGRRLIRRLWYWLHGR